MAKNNKTILWIVGIVILALIILNYQPPKDVSVEGDWFLRFWDKDGNEITVPQEFMIVAEEGVLRGYTIWTTESPIVCPPATCPTGSTCWNGECVIKNIASMSLGFSVKSDSSTVTYTALKVKAATPTEWKSSLTTSSYTLAPLATQVFTSSAFAIPTLWEGTSKTFSVTIQGTNSYDETIEESTRAVTYKFYADPAGGFTVTISNPFA